MHEGPLATGVITIKNKLFIIFFSLITGFIALFTIYYSFFSKGDEIMPNNQRTLHYAVHGLLGELKPARQSTALADILLSAGFEPLTIDNGNGFYSAGIAKEWRVVA